MVYELKSRVGISHCCGIPPSEPGGRVSPVPGSGRYEALDSSKTGCFPRTFCLPRVPP